MRTFALLLLAFASLAAADTVTVVNANVASAEQAPEVREGVPFKALVTVRNPYQRAVKVSKVDSTCSCTTLDLASRFLIPGETTTLSVEVASLRRSGPQQIRASLFLSDPELEPIEVHCWWTVLPAVAVDAIPPGQPALERPADVAWRDIYRFVVHERPDEPRRLRKRIRLWSPPAYAPPGGLKIEGIDYPGTLWAFAIADQGNGSFLITATARDQEGPLPTGSTSEKVVVRTNHPDKPRIELQFDAAIDLEAGRETQDPMQELMKMPPGPGGP